MGMEGAVTRTEVVRVMSVRAVEVRAAAIKVVAMKGVTAEVRDMGMICKGRGGECCGAEGLQALW